MVACKSLGNSAHSAENDDVTDLSSYLASLAASKIVTSVTSAPKKAAPTNFLDNGAQIYDFESNSSESNL